MLVFGHYAITTRTIRPDELPMNMQPPPGVQIQKIVRVAHLFWIPFFPFEKIWSLRQNGQLLRLQPGVTQSLDQMFGPVSTPWYAFSGPLLLVAAAIFFQINSMVESRRAKAFEQAIMANTYKDALSKIDTPQQNDYYLFKADLRWVPGKFRSAGADSLTLLLGEIQQHEMDNSALIGYFMNPNALVWAHNIAKSDLKKSCAIGDGSANAQELYLNGAFQNQSLIIRDVRRLDPSQYTIQYKDETAAVAVKKALQAFMKKSTDTDASLAMLDSASVSYLNTMLTTAKSEEFSEMKAFIEKNEYRTATYKNMIYTNFFYLKAGENSGKRKTDLKDYVFFLKLLNQGLWRVDFEKDTKVMEHAELGEVIFFSPTAASIRVKMPSDQLVRREVIPFDVVLHLEKGAWKINLPSSYEYTDSQIARGISSMNRNKEYRKMVLEELKKTDEKVLVGPEWAY